MKEIFDKIKTYFGFNEKEVKGIILASLVVGLVFALRNWTDATVMDLLSGIIIAVMSIFFHIAVQKIVAIKVGFTTEFKVWWNGILISLLLIFITRGNVWWILLPGGIMFSMIAKHRLGKFRYGMNYLPMGLVSFTGPIASIAFGTIFKNLDLYLPFLGISPAFLHSIFIFNLVLAVCTMLPIPPLDGHYLFYASRTWYVFFFGAIFTYTVFAIVFEMYSWIWAALLGLAILVLFYARFEKGAWH